MAHKDAEAKRRYHREYQRRRRADPEFAERERAQRRERAEQDRKDPAKRARRAEVMREFRARFYAEDPRGIAIQQVRDQGCVDCGWRPGCGWHYGARNWIDLDHVHGYTFPFNRAHEHTLG